jgi:hypothetical protein
MVSLLSGAQIASLFGGSTGSQPLSATDRMTLYRNSVANADRESARLARDPALLRDLARLDKAVAKAKTPEELFKDPEAVRVLLQGLGLADQAQNVGLAKHALTSDPASSTSLAARLPDSRWKEAAKQLDFAGSGLATLRGDAMRKVIADGLVEYKRLSKIGEQSRAVADALYIRKMEAGKTPGVYDVLGNKVLRRVAQTIAGLPDQLALQSIEQQARTLGRGIKLEDFASEKKREALIQRYLLTAEDSQASSLPTVPGLTLNL